MLYIYIQKLNNSLFRGALSQILLLIFGILVQGCNSTDKIPKGDDKSQLIGPKATNSLREEIKLVEIDFKKSIDSVQYSEVNYKAISSTIDFIKQQYRHIDPKTLESAILFLGPTGVGKSTLLEYLANPDNLVINEKSKLEPKDKSKAVAEIGGTSSTTLFPNFWKSESGAVIMDCAGNFDSEGIIANIINSKIRSVVLTSLQKIKVVLLLSEMSLGAEGSYGKVFVDSLNENFQFLSKIALLKDSLALVVSHASRFNGTHNEVVEKISNIVKTHSEIDKYKDVLENIIKNKRIATFSKPSEEAEPNTLYEAPNWNKNQNAVIKGMIDSMPFTEIKQHDFFNLSCSNEVKVSIQAALKIVKKKATLLLSDIVKQNSRPNIYAVELRPFMKFVNNLRVSNPGTISEFIKVFKYNGYFKINASNNELVDKLDYELKFLSEFIDDQKEATVTSSYENWIASANIKPTLDLIYDDAKALIDAKNSFAAFKTRNNLITKPTSDRSITVATDLERLYNLYNQKKQSEAKKNDNTSEFYKNATRKVFSGTRDVPYQIDVPYTDIETYYETEYYTQPEAYTVQEQGNKQLPYNTIKYYNTLTGRLILEQEGRNVNLLGEICNSPNCLNIKITMKESVVLEGCNHLRREESYTGPVTKYRDVQKSRQVPRQRPVQKTRKETRTRQENVYSDQTYREFDEAKYNAQIASMDQVITNLRNIIITNISQMPKGVMKNFEKETVYSSDNLHKTYEDLMMKWRDAEYKAYFAQNPDKSLE